MSEGSRSSNPAKEAAAADTVGLNDASSAKVDTPEYSIDPLGETEMGATATDVGQRLSRDRARPLIGSMLAHYRIEKLLGRGGMGEVYLATDTALERPVAIKILPRTVADDQRLQERFYREARAQARLQHSNICHIYFVGQEDGHSFFAMEYIEGESLQARLERDGAIPANEAIELCRMAALGLREAHAHGFTHRDIKPSNLMVDKNGVVKVVDFGLVKQTAESASQAPIAGGNIAKTSVVGTPLYMAPEQGGGDAVDFRADIYALGATLHQLVAGKPPFAGSTAVELLSQHACEQRPRLASDDKRLSAVDVLCDRMMAKRPEDRFASYDELVAAIDRVSPVRTRPAGFWVRSFALAIDFLFAALVTIPLELSTSIDSNVWILLVGAVYIPVAHARWGRTFGKALLELEIIPGMQTERITYLRALVRYVVQWAPLFVLAAIAWASGAAESDSNVLEGVMTGLAILAPAILVFEGAVAAWRSPSKETLWDRVAGTQVCYRRGH